MDDGSELAGPLEGVKAPVADVKGPLAAPLADVAPAGSSDGGWPGGAGSAVTSPPLRVGFAAECDEDAADEVCA